MYKVFLVDDEVGIREGMRDNVKWSDANFIFSGEASDGEMALPLIKEIKPDAIITDIKMPFMDGLQLSRVVRKSMPSVKIIILTGHDEFDYAKEAIGIGVTDFLLKPVCASELIEVLKKTAAKIEQDRKKESESIQLQEQLESNAMMIRDRFLNELVLGVVPLQDTIDDCEKYQIDIFSKYYLVAIIEAEVIPQDTEDKSKEYATFKTIVDEKLKDNNNVIKFNRSVGELILILKGDDADELNTFAYELLASLKTQVELNSACVLDISLGSVKERFQGITNSYKEADIVSKYKYLYGKNKILGINDIKPRIKEYIKYDDINVSEFMRSGLYKDINNFVDKFVESMKEKGMDSFIYVNYTLIDIMTNAAKFVRELGRNIEEILPEAIQFEDDLAIVDSVPKFKELMINVLERVLICRDNMIEDKYYCTISKAKEYINRNFADPSISLNSVASYVNISPSYFSSLFGQETGETFIEYLTKLRIKKAKELLKTTLKRTSEIAYNVGYNDHHYFSYIFKKWEGITPKEFRNK